MDFVGFGSIEYKWDPASERFVIIEPTVGRTNWQEEIATFSGMNLPLAGYCYECGLPPPTQTPTERPVVWQASYVERMKVGVSVIPPGSIVVDRYWRRDDPMPAFVQYPIDLAMSAPFILFNCSVRWRQWVHLGMQRLRKTENIPKLGWLFLAIEPGSVGVKLALRQLWQRPRPRWWASKSMASSTRAIRYFHSMGVSPNEKEACVGPTNYTFFNNRRSRPDCNRKHIAERGA